MSDDLRAIKDQLEIQRLNAVYNWACYERDPAALAACYVAEGIYESGNTGGRHTGRDAIAASLQAAKDSTWSMGHVTADSVVEIDGDVAHQKVFVVLYRRESAHGENAFFATGTYQDVLRRTADGWKYVHRLSTIDRSRLPWWESNQPE